MIYMGIRNSWLDVVKKAFGSPTKPTRITSDHEEEDQGSYQKKVKQQRRWSFKKQAASITTIQIQILHHHHHESNNPILSSTCATKTHDHLHDHAITALAPSDTTHEIHKEAAAALVIQTSFRGYLARRALEALKGVVKLQALIRGDNVRKMTLLKCMHSLLHLQARLSDQRRINAYRIIHQEDDNNQAAACLFQKTQVAPKKDLPNAPCSSSFIHQQFCGSKHLEQQEYWEEWDQKVKKDTTSSCFSPSSCQRRPHNQTSYYQHQQQRFDDSIPPFSSPQLLHKSRIQLSSACSSPQQNLSAGGVNGTGKPRRYMCATASAMARQRILSTTEGDKKPSVARKRLSFNISEKHNYINISDISTEVDLRSPQTPRRLSMSSSSCCCKQRTENEIDYFSARPQIYGDQRDKVRRL